MILNIAIPFPSVRTDIFQMLENEKEPHYRFIKWINPIEAQFEVTDDGSHGDLVHYTKHLIHQSKYGNVIMFRVLINGQVFDGGPILKDQMK